MKTPEKLYIVMVGLHTTEKRPTFKFSNAAEKGIIYTPMPKEYVKHTSSQDTRPLIVGNTIKMVIEFPPEVVEKVHSGEVVVMMPKGGLHAYAGNDVVEKIVQMDKKKRKQTIHSGRTWRKE